MLRSKAGEAHVATNWVERVEWRDSAHARRTDLPRNKLPTYLRPSDPCFIRVSSVAKTPVSIRTIHPLRNAH